MGVKGTSTKFSSIKSCALRPISTVQVINELNAREAFSDMKYIDSSWLPYTFLRRGCSAVKANLFRLPRENVEQNDSWLLSRYRNRTR
ncbi:hypothetical protein AVEN_162888-1, partial [Araneus ventricosus]